MRERSDETSIARLTNGTEPAFDGPALVLPAYQKAAVESKARFTWNCWSRQTGKSFTFSLRRVLRGLFRRRNQIILSAGERQSREVMEKVRSHCFALKAACELRGFDLFDGIAVRGLEARLPGRVRIIALPANPMTARGFTGDVFLDEFAMHRDDDAIWAALFPTLLRGDGELDIASTPFGRNNMFHRLRSNNRFACSTVTLADAVSQGLDANIESTREAIGDELIWRQEFCCEFLDESSSFLSLELIRSCEDARLSPEPDMNILSQRDAEVFIGIDVGRVRDVTAIWLWRREGEAFETLGVRVLKQTSFDEQEREAAALIACPAVRRCCLDATGMGRHLAERLTGRFGEHRVDGVTFTASTKSLMAGSLRMMAERGLLRIPATRDILNDWHAITRIVTAGGHVRLDAQRSGIGHGDRFWAAALGLHAAENAGSTPGGEIGFPSGSRLIFGRSGVW